MFRVKSAVSFLLARSQEYVKQRGILSSRSSAAVGHVGDHRSSFDERKIVDVKEKRGEKIGVVEKKGVPKNKSVNKTSDKNIDCALHSSLLSDALSAVIQVVLTTICSCYLIVQNLSSFSGIK